MRFLSGRYSGKERRKNGRKSESGRAKGSKRRRGRRGRGTRRGNSLIFDGRTNLRPYTVLTRTMTTRITGIRVMDFYAPF